MSNSKGTPPELPPPLRTDRVDHIAATLRGLAGVTPWIGGMLAELVNYAIPNQRLERLASYVAVLEQKLAGIEKDVIEAKLASSGYLDLFEDGLHQAVRALTEKRLQYIAAIVKNGLSDEEEETDRYKYLMMLLATLNDIEIIILQSYHLSTHGDSAFQKQREHLLTMGAVPIGSSQEVVDRATVHQDYRLHLVRLNLLRPRFDSIKQGKIPEFDKSTGFPRSSGHQLTRLGRLLLKTIDLTTDDEG